MDDPSFSLNNLRFFPVEPLALHLKAPSFSSLAEFFPLFLIEELLEESVGDVVICVEAIRKTRSSLGPDNFSILVLIS